MPRCLRVEFPGALHHVTARAVDGQLLFLRNADREAFLELVADVVRARSWSCLAYCLMSNHYHLVLETPAPGLAHGLQWLNGVYGQTFNRRHRRRGHLLEGRYRAGLILNDRHLLETSRYVVLNPVRAGVCRHPRDWPWSSYRATAGEADPPPFLAARSILALFGGDTGSAHRRYCTFVGDRLLQSASGRPGV